MCTDFLLTAAENRAFVNGRSMEFGLELNSRPLVRRRGDVMRSRTSDKTLERNGLEWTVKYGYVGMNVFKLSLVVDGLNERGLSVGTLWLPGSEYQKVSDPNRALSVLLVNDWLLGTCASVADVKAALPTVEVWAYKPMEEKLAPVHFTVHDASGNSIVIEYTAGRLHIYDNPIATTTNAPVFPWHLENVRNYVGLTPWDVDEATVNGTVFTPTGHGSGLRGIPGDFTPPSRLIRTLFLMNSANRRRRMRARREIWRCTFSTTSTYPRALCAPRALSADERRLHAVGRGRGSDSSHVRLPALRRPRPAAHRPAQDRLQHNQIGIDQRTANRHARGDGDRRSGGVTAGAANRTMLMTSSRASFRHCEAP